MSDLSQSINILNNCPLRTGRQRTIVLYNTVNVLTQSDIDIVCFIYKNLSIPQGYYTIINSHISNATRHVVYHVEYVNEGKTLIES